MKPQPIPSGSRRVPQAARCETEPAPGCADTRCGRQLPAADNAKRPEIIRARRGEEQRSLRRPGLELSCTGCPGWGSAPAGCGVLHCSRVPGGNFG